MKILLVVDVQNDFCPGGSLAVPDGATIVPVINKLMSEGSYDLVIATKDWHPSAHKSFATNNPGHALYSEILLKGLPQTMWPDHCVQNSIGADFHPGLKQELVNQVVYKGTDTEIDSYSGFFDNAKLKETDLRSVIESTATKLGIPHSEIDLHVVGLATDYCVKATAIDAAELGFSTSLVIDACRAVNLNAGDEEKAIREMIAAGVEVVESRNLLAGRSLRLITTRAAEMHP